MITWQILNVIRFLIFFWCLWVINHTHSISDLTICLLSIQSRQSPTFNVTLVQCILSRLGKKTPFCLPCLPEGTPQVRFPIDLTESTKPNTVPTKVANKILHNILIINKSTVQSCQLLQQFSVTSSTSPFTDCQFTKKQKINTDLWLQIAHL